MKLLIVDDSVQIRERLINLISNFIDEEYISQARNSNEAMNLLNSGEFDLAILDINMPGGNGITILEEIKNKNKETITIMFTSYPYPQFKDACIKAGADYFFDKANEVSELSGVLSKILKQSAY